MSIEAVNVATLRAVTVPGEQGCDADDPSASESWIALPQTGTYIMGTSAAVPARVDLLVQALGIVEGVIARLGANGTYELARAESWGLQQLCERIRDLADNPAPGLDGMN